MNARLLLVFLSSLPWLFVDSSAFAEIANAVGRQQYWRARLERHPFVFVDEMTGLWPSFIKFDADAEVHIVNDPKTPKRLEIRFVVDGSAVVSIQCNRHTSFAAGENRLFLAQYEPDFPGCTLIAYDLTSGQEIWRTKLHQKQPGGASAYRNRVSIGYFDEGGLSDTKNEGSVLVKGSETYCDYIEVLDAKTGESIAIKHYRVVGFGK